jgi:hypothetical protein
VGEVEAVLRQAKEAPEALKPLSTLPGRILLTPQAESAITTGIPESRVRDFLYRHIGEKFQQREAFAQRALWPRPNGTYRLFTTALAGTDADYIIYLILTDPLAAPPEEPILVLAAEVILLR